MESFETIRNTVYRKPAANQNPPRPDRFTGVYIGTMLVFFVYLQLVAELNEIYDLYLFAVAMIGPPLLALPVLGLYAVVVNALRLRWRQVTSLVVAPFIAYGAVTALQHVGLDMDWVRFEFRKAAMMEDVSRLEASSEGNAVISWGWGETGGAGVSNLAYTMIYDPTDEIVHPSSTWSPEFRSRVKRAKAEYALSGQSDSAIYGLSEGEPNATLRSMGGHFYLATYFID